MKTPTMEKIKTHWLQNPNKNYLGHQDLPNGEDIIVTIKSANWEEVKDPTRWTKDLKRVIHFLEQWVKPLICNETNAEMIMKVTWTKFMEDAVWRKIQLYVSQTKMMKQYVDCLRVREQIIEDNFSNKQALESLKKCETLEELQKAYLSLSHKEKADKEVINLKDNLKNTLWKK